MIETIKFEDKLYPHFQSIGNAAQFAIPYAKHVCKGIGFDIGFNKKEWKFPGAIGIDITMEYTRDLFRYRDGRYHALNLPNYIIGDDLYDEVPDNLKEDVIDISKVDYIFSSHCLEHLENWINVLDYWMNKIKPSGTLFLYLPDYSQEYWRPWYNRKHLHIFTPDMISAYLKSRFDVGIFYTSGVDLNNSFMVMVEKFDPRVGKKGVLYKI